jgi:mannose-6-phosphate isomerase-like protein (cupin superfamily)
MEEERDCCMTPKGKKFQIPPFIATLAAPLKKRQVEVLPQSMEIFPLELKTEEEGDCYVTPKGKEFQIPTIAVTPIAPLKKRQAEVLSKDFQSMEIFPLALKIELEKEDCYVTPKGKEFQFLPIATTPAAPLKKRQEEVLPKIDSRKIEEEEDCYMTPKGKEFQIPKPTTQGRR